jgi:threonylcarbamoyladenosine tRNA methylthiotransferase MtaB
MHRKYTTAEYMKSVKLLRSNIKDVAISTDIMVGFPGETDDEFKKTYDFLEEIAFAKMHVFKYSKRKGTPASTYINQVTPEKKEDRSDILHKLSTKKSLEFNKGFIGRELVVLFENKLDENKEYIEGYTANYLRVIAKGDLSMKGQIYLVRVIKILEDYLEGEIIRKQD